MIIYLAGKMTGCPNYNRTAFILEEARLSELGHTVLSPANHIPLHNPEAISHSQYMHIGCAMIDAADAVYLLPGWEDSPGANAERKYAEYRGKIVEVLE